MSEAIYPEFSPLFGDRVRIDGLSRGYFTCPHNLTHALESLDWRPYKLATVGRHEESVVYRLTCRTKPPATIVTLYREETK